jgi:PPOX class probable F420-dependent enzyme
MPSRATPGTADGNPIPTLIYGGTLVVLDDVPDWALALLETQPVGHLGLLDERGYPRVQPVTFALAGAAVFTAVDHKPKRGVPARIARLQANPACALTVDRYDDDWSKLAWIQLVGNATICDEVPAALIERYPQYRERPPQGPAIRLDPLHAVWWRG